MRLGQLARHLETTTAEIIQFLSNEGVDKNDHPNVKLSEDDEKLVINHFRPDLLNKYVEEITAIEEIVEVSTEDVIAPALEPATVEEPKEEIKESDKISDELDTTLPDSEVPTAVESKPVFVTVTAAELNPEDEDTPVNANFDLIKAPKVELPGLKVVGKIELPQPKAKEPELEEESAEEEESQELSSDPKVITHHKKNARRRLTEEEREERRLKNKREKEKRIARQEARRKAQEEKRIKQQKEEHYKQKIAKPAPVNKAKKKKSNKTPEGDTRPKPKTILGKFWRWLNT